MTVSTNTFRFAREDDPSCHRIATRDFADIPNVDKALALLDEIGASDLDLKPVSPCAPLVLYGAGNLGRLARDHLRAVGQDFALVVDRNAEALSADPGWEGVEIVIPDKVPPAIKASGMLAVSIALSPFAPLQAALEEAGWRTIVPFYDLAENFRDRHPLSNGWFAAPFAAPEVAAVKGVMAGWSDDLSRAHHLQFIAWRRLRQEWHFHDAPVTTGDRFFIPEVLAVLGNDEVFVDAGAHHGSVTERFIQETRSRFRDIIAIEPDPQSRDVLERTVSRLPWCQEVRVAVLDKLLDAEDRQAPFHGGLGYASQVSSTGTEQRQTVTLDSLDLPMTYLKLHLEGHELQALKGGRETILYQRPIIAATVYHNADGISATAEWLMQTLPGYRLLFRLHSWCGTGAVIYAIPEERFENHG